MTSAIKQSAKPAIEYPDDDGEPMSDNSLQFGWIVLIVENLQAVFLDDPNVFVAGNLLWYPVDGEPTIRAAPDALVAFGRPKGRRGSYKQWEEVNIAPQVVFETLSPGNRPEEMERKFKFYEQYGVEEYYIYDPDDGRFEALLRRGPRLVRVKAVFGFVSRRLQIRFEPGPGSDNLKIFWPDGELFQRPNVDIGRRKGAEKRASTAENLAAAESERADAERERAAAEKERADRLAAQLRTLGLESD